MVEIDEIEENVLIMNFFNTTVQNYTKLSNIKYLVWNNKGVAYGICMLIMKNNAYYTITFVHFKNVFVVGTRRTHKASSHQTYW